MRQCSLVRGREFTYARAREIAGVNFGGGR